MAPPHLGGLLCGLTLVSASVTGDVGWDPAGPEAIGTAAVSLAATTLFLPCLPAHRDRAAAIIAVAAAIITIDVGRQR